MNDEVPPGNSPATTDAAPAEPPDPGRVAAAQKLLIYSMGIVVIAVAIDMSLARWPAAKTAGTVLDVVALLLSIYGVVRMGSAIRSPLWLTVICAATMFVAILNVFVLGWLNARAMKVLRAAGWKVGFLGAYP